MPSQFSQDRVVEFAETDMAGIVHFSNFFRYMEACEHAFFRSLDIELHRSEPGGAMSGWARVHAECDYREPLRYQDLVRVSLVVTGKTGSTLSYDFAFAKVAGAELGREVARGRLTVAYVGRESSDQAIRARKMPEVVSSTIEVAPAALLNSDKE